MVLLKKLSPILLILFLVFNTTIIVNAQEEHHPNNHHEQTQDDKKKEFNTGDFIFDHIKDHYSWHVFTYKGNHISIPLLIIAKTHNNGWQAFSSGKLKHGHVHKELKIPENGEYKNELVEVNDKGEIVGTPIIDISITKNVLAIFVSGILLVLLFTSIAKAYKKRDGQPPKGMQSLLEPLILFIRDDIAKASIGEKNYERFAPFLLTIFFFIFFNNILGLIPIFPGGANVTGNITVTMGLALFTFFVTTINGNKNYWKHIFNATGVPWWLKVPLPLMPFIELVGVFIKPFVLMVRLFANISAGHIVTLGFFSLIFIFGNMNNTAGYLVSPLSILFTIFMTFLELLVAFIQAYVFTILSAIYFGMAVETHH